MDLVLVEHRSMYICWWKVRESSPALGRAGSVVQLLPQQPLRKGGPVCTRHHFLQHYLSLACVHAGIFGGCISNVILLKIRYIWTFGEVYRRSAE